MMMTGKLMTMKRSLLMEKYKGEKAKERKTERKHLKE